MNYDELKPGPELDRLVAEKVMEYVVANHAHKKSTFVVASSQRAVEKARANGVDFWGWDDEGNAEFCYELPCYSTDIACAWQVIEHLKEKGFTVYLFYNTESESNYLWRVGFRSDETWSPTGEAPIAPLAICIAALKAMENGS